MICYKDSDNTGGNDMAEFTFLMAVLLGNHIQEQAYGYPDRKELSFRVDTTYELLL